MTNGSDQQSHAATVSCFLELSDAGDLQRTRKKTNANDVTLKPSAAFRSRFGTAGRLESAP